MWEKISSLIKRNKIVRFRRDDKEEKPNIHDIRLFYAIWVIIYNTIVLGDTVSDFLQAWYLYKGNGKNIMMIY